MLQRVILAVFLCAAAVPFTSAQTRDSDSQTLLDILAELRAMHEDMRVTETTQLLVAELQMQQGAVNRATESVDNARGKLNDIHHDQRQVSYQMQRDQDLIDKSTDENEKKSIAGDIDRCNGNLAQLKVAERDAGSTLQDMQQRLQNAQDKLAEIEAEMSAAIARLSPGPKAAGQR